MQGRRRTHGEGDVQEEEVIHKGTHAGGEA